MTASAEAPRRGDRIRLGLLLPTSAGHPKELSFDQVLGGAAAAEDAGFDALWFTDHLFHGKPMFEPLTAMALALSCTKRVTVGTAVLQLAMRPIAIAAKQIANLAIYAPGRVEIGIGVGGEYPSEWEAVNIPLNERGARTTEAVEYLRRMLTGETVTEQGRFQSFTDLLIEPWPPAPVPLLFAGRRPAALRRAARLGDGWIGAFHTASGFQRDREAIIEERRRLGLPVEDYSFGMLLALLVDDVDDGASDRALDLMMGGPSERRLDPRYVVAGTPETIVARLAEYAHAGCTDFVLEAIPRGPAWDEQVSRLAALLPTIRAQTAAAGRSSS